jgi:hypothetical protein
LHQSQSSSPDIRLRLVYLKGLETGHSGRSEAKLQTATSSSAINSQAL